MPKQPAIICGRSPAVPNRPQRPRWIRLVAVGVAWTLFSRILIAGEANEAAGAEAAFAKALESISLRDLHRHIEFLASDTLEGREAGTRGGQAAGAYLKERFTKLGLEPAGENGGYFQPFNDGYRNVLGKLPGSDEQLKDEVIIIGAHYDHVGFGYSGNSRGVSGQIHNGADDNASGTTAVLELAEAFTLLPTRPRRTILFALWDGEELGLLGSKHWVANPTVSIHSVKFYINIDMVGRLRNHTLEAYGVRTAVGLRELVAKYNRDGINYNFNWDLIPDSDHYSMLQKRIPFLMPFTGKHEDYHRQTDDADKINYEGEQEIIRHWFRIANDLANRDEVPEFRSEANHEHEGFRRQGERIVEAPPSRLGISWDAAESDGLKKLRIRSISEGEPASRAGLVPGDFILSFNGVSFCDSQSFAQCLLCSVPDSQLTLIPGGVPGARPRIVPIHLKGPPIRFGFGWRRDNVEPTSLILTEVVPGSPADAAGLRPNDRIRRVNDQVPDSTARAHELLSLDREEHPVDFERKGVPHRVFLRPLDVVAPPLRAPRPQPASP